MALATVLVEEGRTIRDSLIPALAELAGAEVIAVAETAEEGIAALTAHADGWQLAVVDMHLREGSGMDVLRYTARRRAGQQVLVLTNYATPEIRRRAKEAGANGVFDKSTEIEQFFALCESLSKA